MVMIDGGGRKEAFSKIKYYGDLKKEGVFVENFITYAPYSIGALNALFSGMNGNVNGVNGIIRPIISIRKIFLPLPSILRKQAIWIPTKDNND